jgi:Ca2+-binding RTX toxin-like protein
MSEVLAADGSENFAVHSATGVVYVAGNDGVLRGFDPVTHQLVSSWQIGTDLQAIAISKDGTYALVTEAVPVSHSDSNDWTSNETVSAVYKVDLASGDAETLTYASTGSDYTLGDVAFTDDNTAVFSQNILPGWSGWAPLVVLDIASGTFTPTGSYYAGPSASSLTQSVSAEQILLGQLNLSSAEYFLIDDGGSIADGNGLYENDVYGYAAGIEAFTGSGNEGRIALVSGGGLHVYDGEFDYIADLAQTHAFLGSSPGITFSADGSTLYAIDATADRIVALSVADWSITGSFAIGNYDYSVLAYGEELALAPDGSQFYVSTTQGVVVVPLMVETRGTAGDDMMVGTAAHDWLSGLGGNDALYGYGGDDQLYGSLGNDHLAGGAGADQLYGGPGNDYYTVEDAFDTILEHAGNGIDTVNSFIASYALGANLENLVLYSGASNGTGNELDNILTGNDTANELVGRGGNDTLYAVGGSDVLRGQDGDDALWGGLGHDDLFGGAGADTLQGDGGNDRVYGNAGDDFVNGGLGNDNVFGGGGNDRVHGGNGADLVNGQAGDDFIVGGPGNDLLVGGLGADRFVFNDGHLGGGLSATDRITDFSQAQGDIIDFKLMDADSAAAGDQAFTWIGNAAFGGTAGELRTEIVGNTTYVYGDRDGDGTADFALWLTGQIGLTEGDFVL